MEGSLYRIWEQSCPWGRFVGAAEQEGAADPGSMAGGSVCVCVCVVNVLPLWLFCCFLAGFLLSPLLGSLAPAHCCTKCWPLCKPHPYCDPIRDALLSFNSQIRR